MTNQTPRIGLYGGSFNPPHIAHVLVVGWVLSLGEVDQVWVIPTGGHPFGKDLAPFEDRMEMCRRAFACYGDRVRLMDIEKEAKTHYTIDTLHALGERHPDCRWRWIMGSDTLDDAPKWRQFDEVMCLAPPLVIPRRGYRAEAGGNAGPHKAGSICGDGFALPDVSSTLIRRMLHEGRCQELAGLLPGPVIEWIRQRALYGVTK